MLSVPNRSPKTKNFSREKAIDIIQSEMTKEINKLTERSMLKGDSDEEKVEACISKQTSELLKRELSNFLWEVEDETDNTPHKIFRQVIKNMMEFENNRFK
jgi:hypothetical protein